jgi:hypothetical protein
LYNTTTALAAALAAKRLNLKAVCGSTTLEGNQIANCTYSASIGGADALTIGGVTAAMVTLTINQEVAWRDKTIVVSVGAEVDGATQYVPLGTFIATDCKQAEGTTAITAYDAAYYALGGTYTPTVSSGATVAAVLSDVAAQCGLTLAALPAAASTTTVTGDLTGTTCRDMVGYLAALVGCNALIDRDGALALRWFFDSGQSYSPSDYYNAGLSIDGTSTLACIQAEVETTTTDADGNTSATTNTYTAGGTGTGISIQNPYMTQAILDTVWASIGGLEYTIGSCDIFHGLLVEPGDLVTITDKAGVAHTLAVMSLTMTIDGGCKTTLQATGESTTDASAAMQGSLGGKVSQLVVDLAKVKQLIIEDVNGVTKIYGGRIDTKSLFAQDITATGTITGAQLIGAILSGNAIDIQAVVDASTIGIKTEETSGNVSLVLSASGGTTKGEITLSRGVLKLFGQSLLELATNELYINADTITDAHYSTNTYTSFSGSVLSSGSVTVTKKLGMCFISGTLALSKSISAWTAILSSSKVPAPQHGELVPFEASQWGTSYARPLRGKVTPDGGLQLVYGAAGNYVFTISYPID